jgi:hypothetical protein
MINVEILQKNFLVRFINIMSINETMHPNTKVVNMYPSAVAKNNITVLNDSTGLGSINQA